MLHLESCTRSISSEKPWMKLSSGKWGNYHDIHEPTYSNVWMCSTTYIQAKVHNFAKCPTSIYEDFKCVCLCVTEVENSGGRTTVVKCELRTYYTLCCMCVITSRRTRAVAAVEDAVGEQQLKRIQWGSSSWSGRNRGAVQSDHARLVLARDATAQGCWCVRVGG